MTDEHVVAPGSKPAGEVLGGNLRETKPGDVLEESRARAQDDPPTAEVSLDGLSSDVEDTPSEEEDEDAAPAFGIVHRKRTRSAKPTPTKQALARNLGVEVVTNTGHRDNVYGQLKSGAHALARIGARPSVVTPVHLEADDADLPAPTGGAEHEDAPAEETNATTETSSAKISKLDKLRAAKASRELAAVPRIDPSEVGEPSEISEPDASEPSEPDLELGEAAPVQSEPDVVMLDVEDSEGYELGDAEVPTRAEPPRRDIGGIIVGVVLLVVIAAAAFIALT